MTTVSSCFCDFQPLINNLDSWSYFSVLNQSLHPHLLHLRSTTRSAMAATNPLAHITEELELNGNVYKNISRLHCMVLRGEEEEMAEMRAHLEPCLVNAR